MAAIGQSIVANTKIVRHMFRNANIQQHGKHCGREDEV